MGKLIGSGDIPAGVNRRYTGLQVFVDFNRAIRVESYPEFLETKAAAPRRSSYRDYERVELNFDFGIFTFGNEIIFTCPDV